jgi:hypothetical protein
MKNLLLHTSIGMSLRPRKLLRWILPACLAATASAGPIYDLVAGFSNLSNPSGVFSYYYGPATDTLYSSPSQSFGTCGTTVCGWNQVGGVPDDIYIEQNTTGSTSSGGTVNILNNYLNLDPEGYNAEVVFTAPTAGTYLISGNFYGDDSSEQSHPVDIFDDISSVVGNPYGATISAYQQEESFSISETLSVGDTITFFTGVGSTYADLSTGLQGTLTLQTSSPTTTPEPASVLLAGAGFAALVARRFTSRRSRS